MSKLFQLILISLISIICVAGGQTDNTKNCQRNLINVKNNFVAAVKNLKNSGVKDDFSQKARILENKKNNWKNSTGNINTQIDLIRDPFNLAAIMAYNQKTLKIAKILHEIVSVARTKELDTLILHNFSETIFEYGKFFTKYNLPLILIRNSTNYQLKYIYSSNILNVIFLEADWYSKVAETFAIVKKNLKGLHLTKIIILKETSIKKEDKNTLEIFEWLHTNGFWQSLLMDFKGNSLTLQHLTGELLWNMTLQEFLLQSTRWRNLLGFPINCSMASNPPRAFIQYDSQQKVTLKGYYGTVINLFAKHYNASLKPFVLSNLDYYTEMDCVKYINIKKVDICGDALPSHEQYVITNPDEIVGGYLMVPYDKPLSRFYYFLKPFQLNVWTIVTVSFLYKVITLAFIHRIQQGSWNASLQMLYALLSVLYLPFQLTYVKNSYRRFLEFLMIIVGFVVANWYLSVLSSLLFTRLYSHDIKTLQNLVDHNISIMIDEFELFLLNATENDAILMQQLKVVSNEVLLQHRRNLDPHYAYYSQYDKVNFYLHQQKFLLRPRMKVLTGIPPINEVLGGIPMSPNWPFQHLLNDLMLRIIDSGLYQRIYANAMEDGIRSGYLRYFPTEYHSVESLSIEYFEMPAMLLAIGFSLAFAAFLFELLMSTRNEVGVYV